MKKIAITGGIGSGKSVVSALLQMMGYPVYNSDEQSKRLLNEDRELRKRLSETFGKDLYKNGQLDKVFFASLIFSDEKLLQKANEIIHPAVYRDFNHWAKTQTTELVFIETALYFQGEAKQHIPFSILVQAPPELRIKRTIQRDNCTEKEVLARINKQITYENVSHLADFHIINDGKHLLIPQILQIIKNLTNLKI